MISSVHLEREGYRCSCCPYFSWLTKIGDKYMERIHHEDGVVDLTRTNPTISSKLVHLTWYPGLNELVHLRRGKRKQLN